MLGAVVVGIGRAGQARMRDLLAPLPSSPAEKLVLKGFVSRRTLDEQQAVKQISLEDALNRQDIQVALVCTENASHEDLIRKFLEAGKHVCVEYPMALSHTVAKELWELAEKKGKVLHEEHIELLTADYKQLKKDLAGKSLQEGTLHFTGGPAPEGFGFPSFSGLSRLTWLVDLFGELAVTGASLTEDRENAYSKLTVQLLTCDQRPLTWLEERGPGLRRGKRVSFRLDSGAVVDALPAAPREPVGLFMQDLGLFAQKLLGQVPAAQLEAERRRVLHCLELAQRVRELAEASA
ncbi:biliverdin reductase A isoform X2 [Anguilla anguilla]|uniref:biliverdin reductase A isoform X1 n=1 Tax=Anguilla anguilla TaxID=7936 RepID=UPI0015AB2398|nr:biliverdin reductase A isoform X1 [Anguilla anguilla]XP_035286221.1 biliverdin reductase A isoform X1 [Anguilla anguilla]XP_035286222.1 biliverdin reductase A isoform X2 [Anguilla anguilla]